MATKILLKKSVTGGSAPLTGDLDQGELAINLVDRKIYTKNNAGAVITVSGAFVDSVAPANPAEGDLWYDTANNILKAHNGSTFEAAGYQTVAALEDTAFSGLTDNDLLAYDQTSGKWTNQSPAEAGFATVATSGSYTDLTNKPYIPADANNATITISAGSGLTGGGNFTTNQSVNETLTLNVDLNELNSSTSDADGDFFVVVDDAGAQKKLDKAAINLSGFNNDIGFLTVESDTLATVTGRGNTTSSAIQINNATASTSASTGALIVSGGAGVGGNLNVGGNVVVTGNLTVDGTTTSVNSNEVNIGDAVILLNADEAGAPSQNAGFEIERGTSANVAFLWDETNDVWSLGNETLANVVIDGGSY